MRFIIVLMMVLTGCSYKANTSISPSYDVYSSYSEMVPGRFALYVDGRSLDTVIKPSTYTCSAHTYPIQARAAFEQSVLRTFENLVEEVVPVSRPLNRDQLFAQEYDVMVLVEAREIDLDLEWEPGFWSNKMEASAEIISTIRADDLDGRKLGGSVSGRGKNVSEAGFACDGGSKAVGAAVEDAMQRTMGQLGDRLSNAPRLRTRASIADGERGEGNDGENRTERQAASAPDFVNTRTYRVTVNWHGLATQVEGELDGFSYSSRAGSFLLKTASPSLKCQGEWKAEKIPFKNRKSGSGSWEMKCNNSLSVVGVYRMTSDVSGRANGTDGRGEFVELAIQAQ